MKILRVNLLLSIVLVLGVVSGPVWSQELKVGFVNAAGVLEKAPQAETARTDLEKEFAPRDRKLVAEQKNIRQMEEKLSRDGAIMSDSERNKLERDIRSAKRDLKRSRDEFREDLNIRRNEELAKLQKLVVQTIREIARESNFDLVVTDGVLYASDRINITAQVLEKLKNDAPKKADVKKP